MTAAALIAELAHAGIRLSQQGDRLHVEARPGVVTPALRERLTRNKSELLIFLGSPDAIRTQLLTLAACDGIDAAPVHHLRDNDLAACRACTIDELRGYLRALDYSARMDAGQAPPGYTQTAECSGCGPVLLWPGAPASVTACPWCFRRRAGKAIPRPSAGQGKELQHG